MTDNNCEDQEPLAGLLVTGGGDSDVDSSQSVCSGSDTHSGHTSLSVLTDKSSASGTTIHVTSTGANQSPEHNTQQSDQQPNKSPSTSTLIATPNIHPPSSPTILPITTTPSNNPQSTQTSQQRFGVGTLLPWGVHKDRGFASVSYPIGAAGTAQGTTVGALSGTVQGAVDMDIRPGEFVMRTLFADFTVQAEKKIEAVMSEPQDKLISKLLQRGGEDAQFDQLLSSFGSVAEHCLPSLLRALFSWYERQMSDQALAYYHHKPHYHHPQQQQQHTRNKSNDTNNSLQSTGNQSSAIGSLTFVSDSSAVACNDRAAVVGVQTQQQYQAGVGGSGYGAISGSAYSMGVEDKMADKSGSGTSANNANVWSDYFQFQPAMPSSSTITSTASSGTNHPSSIPHSHSASTPTPGSSGPGSCSSSSASSTVPIVTPPHSTIGSASGVAISTQTNDSLLLASLAGSLTVVGGGGGGTTVSAAERSEAEVQQERRDLAVEFLFCLVLIEVLRQLNFHPGHEDLVAYIECLAFKHFKYRDGIQSSQNAGNIHIIADLYAEVIGALAQSRFMSVRARFMTELKELRTRDPSPHTTQMIIALLMGMKFFRVKMVPIEEFEASFQFMQECAQYFLDPNIKDKDIKHALAGLFVEILVPVAASVKNEVNVPCLKNFVEMLYSSTLDASTKSKHRLALFPLVTCLLCVSQKQFFLQNWHCFLAMCLSHLKNRDHKICRVALESLYRLLWVYMIRIKCESNSATQSRLQSIVNSLFPKGSKAVVPRDTPLNIFVKIIQFIAQERLDFAMREIVFDLLSVGRPIKIILTPERMSIGLRAFLVVADSLQQKEGEPPMPRSMGVLPSGNTLRVRKTFLNKMLTDDTARSIGMSSYFPHVRRVFVDILRALDAQYGRPLMMTSTQNVNKEPDEMITGERKPRIDLFRTCVAAVPRLIPDGMTGSELVDLLARLTVHMDEELRGLAFQSLQTLVLDFPDWRHDVLYGVTGFLARDVADTCAAHLVDSGLRMLLQLLGAWKSALLMGTTSGGVVNGSGAGCMRKDLNQGAVHGSNDLNTTSAAGIGQQHYVGNVKGKSAGIIGGGTSSGASTTSAAALTSVLHHVEAFALVTLCQYRVTARRLSVHILREVKQLLRLLAPPGVQSVIDILDGCCGEVVEKCMAALPAAERAAALGGSGGAVGAAGACAASTGSTIDMLWLADRNSAIWTANLQEDGTLKSNSATGTGLNSADPWSMCLFGFLERDRLQVACPAAVAHAWPIVFGRVNMLFPVIDPTPVNDNRASLLRSSATIKKPLNERDMYIHLWKNYITFATRVVPPIPSPIIRCASPDLSISAMEVPLDTSTVTPLADFSISMDNLLGASTVSTPTSSSAQQTHTSELANLLGINSSLLGASTGRFTLPLSAIRRQTQKQRSQASSSPDSLNADRSDQKTSGTNASPNALYKLLVPLLRCEINDVRDAAVIALGYINSEALKDLMEELVLPIREAVDRKQENVRRRRRRDALRLQLVRVLERMAECGTFANNAACVLDHRQALHPIFVEYIEGARLYLDQEPDKMAAGVRDLTVHLCGWIRKLIKSFSLETCHTLLDRSLREHLYTLLSHFAGCYGPPSAHHTHTHPSTTDQQQHLLDNTSSTTNTSSFKHSSHCYQCTDIQLAALQAMSALLCCGPCFNPAALGDDVGVGGVGYYDWLDVMLNSPDERVYALGKETVVLLLECNPDIGPLLDWAVDRCYTGSAAVADGCFLSLATIFSAREYPCDHYTGVINVTLLNTGCPRPTVRDTALQLLQILDKRFFGAVVPLAEGDLAEGDNGRSTLDALLATTYCRSQVHLSGQLALLHPELTMPMFSEITVRLQTARPEVRQLLLQYILPWLHNMELVDPNIPPSNPLFYYQYQGDSSRQRGRREGWGSAEATEMVLNNIFYITAKFDDTHPKEIEEVWATLSTAWPNNMKIIIRYLIIISGMAPAELLPYAKRVVLFLARVEPVRLLDEMMFELQTVETLNCLIERTETPPFYRLTIMRKASSHSDGTGGPGQTDSSSRSDLGVEKGTIHTKRHSGEDPMKCGTPKCENMKSVSEFPSKTRGNINLPEDVCTPATDENLEDLFSMSRTTGDKTDMMSTIPQPLPLPMPEYGGFFAPLSNYLPESSQPISGFHRCNVAVMLLCDIVVDGIELDWNLQVPLMLHVVFLGLDHTRPLVRRHCAQLLLNLLVVLAQHNDHLTVARIMLNSKTKELELGLSVANLPVVSHVFTEPDAKFDAYLHGTMPLMSSEAAAVNKDLSTSGSSVSTASGDKLKEPSSIAPPVIVTPEQEQDAASWTAPYLAQTQLSTQAVIKSMIDFLATRQHVPLWNYEDITAKVWQVRSAEQMECFLQHVLHVFQQSLPSAHVSERWAQTALQLGLSCSSRHYAGRSLQIFRGLRVPITSRMLSDILSRLVETVAEQGEDMQGYVTELLLTLESAVDSLESDFRPLDFLRDFFKSTPNLNNNPHNIPKSRNSNQQQPNDSAAATGNALANNTSTAHNNIPGGGDIVPPLSSTGTGINVSGNSPHISHGHVGHGRSTSYSVSYGIRGSNKMMGGTGAVIGVGGVIGSGVGNVLGGVVGDGSGGGKGVGVDSIRGRTGSEVESRSSNSLYRFCTNLPRSRSAQSLKLLGDSSATQDDKLTILAQLFWLAVSLLESDYEHEFLLALRLLARVLHRLPLDRPDARDKVEKIQTQLRWPQFPGVHALLLKGCTHPNIYEPVVALLSAFTPLLDLPVADPTQSAAFPMNVIALLPYMLLNYEDANDLCIVSAENIAQVSIEKSKKLENLGTVMNLYSRRTFSKESFQWTKCVVKYLNDTYSHMSLAMLAFLVEVLEKGMAACQQPVLNILHCMLHYVDLASAAAQPINADLLRVIARYIEGIHWKEALKILKLVVTRSSSLVAPPTSIQYHSYWEASLTALPHPSFSDMDVFTRKELPGRTMDFTFDLSQTPVIGRRLLTKTDDNNTLNSTKPIASPRRSCSLSPADTGPLSGWKRPWMSQGRVRECLVNLLTTCGQRVGLPKSPSVIFSQSSDLLERQSSMASSTEEVSGANNDLSGGSRRDDATADFGVFKDFDFLEYESESIEAESTDNFNWGVRRRPLSEGEEEPGSLRQLEDSLSEQTPVLTVRKISQSRVVTEESSDDEIGGSESPLDELASVVVQEDFGGADSNNSSSGISGSATDPRVPPLYPPGSSLSRHEMRRKDSTGGRSDTSESSVGDLGDVTPCNDSPNVSQMINLRPMPRSDTIEAWTTFVQTCACDNPSNMLKLFHHLQKLIKSVASTAITLSREACTCLATASTSTTQTRQSSTTVAVSTTIKVLSVRIASVVDIATHRLLVGAHSTHHHYVWFNTTALGGQTAARMTESLRYGMLEVQEHLETYCGKLERATMYTDAAKTSLKLEQLAAAAAAAASAPVTPTPSPSTPTTPPSSTAPTLNLQQGQGGGKQYHHPQHHHEDYLLELSKALYKLYFQLLLLVESAHKMTAHLVQGLRNAGFRDISNEVSAVCAALRRAAEDQEADGGNPIPGQSAVATSPVAGSNTSLEEMIHKIYDLITNERWSTALNYMRQHRAVLVRPPDLTPVIDVDDNISMVVNTYCRKLMVERPDCFVVTNQDSDMRDIYGRLFQVSAALNDLEIIINNEFMQTLNK